MIAINAPQQSREDTSQGTASSAELYRERRARFSHLRDAETQRWNTIGNIRLFTFLLGVAGLIWGLWQNIPLVWLSGIVFIAAFVALVVYHNRIGRLKRRYEELEKISDEAAKRLARSWDELPVRHDMRAEARDPYAA